MSSLLRDLRISPLISSCFGFGDYHHFSFVNEQEEIEKLTAELTQKQHTSLELEKISPTIEDCFIKLMNS